MKYHIAKRKDWRLLFSPGYNYVFNSKTGYFARWGHTKEDDPDFSPVGCEIADIEVSTICHGINGKPCRHCYKSASSNGYNMSFFTFKEVLDNLPPSLTQVALGIGSIDANPDLWDIFQYCRDNDVVPNVTINGDRMTPALYERLVALCGAVAVSRYDPPDVCYNAVQELSQCGLEQVNIHQLLSEETYDSCMELLDDVKNDPRLSKLRAVVFLMAKPVGRGTCIHPVKYPQKYRKLIDKALELGVGFGFDSCSAPTFLKAVEGHERYEEFKTMAEPCESMLFSIYVSAEGKAYPCSFLEHGSFEGIDLTKTENFSRDVWFSKSTVKWRENLIKTACAENAVSAGCRECPAYNLYRE